MSLPEIAKLGHVALITADLEKSLWFFKEVIGLEETVEKDGVHYLRAWGDFEHHTLSLKAGDRGRVDHIAWRAKRPEDVQGFADLLEKAGTKVTWVKAGEEAGQGEAIRFKLPSDHSFEIYYDIEKPIAEESRKSVLKNQVYRSWRKGISPRRIDHVNVATSMEVKDIQNYLREHLGFNLREYVSGADDSMKAAWLSVTSLVHDIAVISRPEAKTPNQLHHISYWVDDSQNLLRAADILAENGIKFIGPGKHGVSQAFYIYVIDPGSGCRVELFAGGYSIFDPDWEPVEWTEEEQPIGNTYWGDSVQDKALNRPLIEA